MKISPHAMRCLCVCIALLTAETIHMLPKPPEHHEDRAHPELLHVHEEEVHSPEQAHAKASK